MRYQVNDQCIGCGLCEGICPDVFSMTDAGVAQAIDQDVPQDALETAAEAMESCPVQAIEEA
ncbi:MAG: ferredoxin [Tissierellia bacterium]|nr:ferredoxin [Tissierellia bacterium]